MESVPSTTQNMGSPMTPDRATAEAAARVLLRLAGGDVTNPDLTATPKRMGAALIEMTSGGTQDPAEILATCFSQPYEDIVVLRGIEFTSVCEHHMLPFHGVAAVGYIPKGRVCGLSKLARLVACFARRLQIQERLTMQIVDALMENLTPRGAGVVVEATHHCMTGRGVQLPRATMQTSAFRGEMNTQEYRGMLLG